MMFEEVMIQIGRKLAAKAKTPGEELGKQRMRKAKAAKSRINQRKAAKAKTPPAEEELGLQRMRKAKAEKPPKAA